MPKGIYIRKPLSEDQKRRMSRKGTKASEETKLKQSVALKKAHKKKKFGFIKGCNTWNKGKETSPETRKKQSEAKKDWSPTKRQLENLIHRGPKHYLWIKDRNEVREKHRLRGTQKWKDWRMKVFERDKYTCQECGVSGVYIEPHHIIPIRSDKNKLFDTNNGITLCRPCHKKTIWKEEKFIESYQSIVNSKR